MSRLLLDTHALIWWVLDDPHLPPRVRGRISDPESDLYVSIVTLWEIAIKVNLGKLRELGSSTWNVLDYLRRENIQILQIEVEHLMVLETLELHHRDPFDRLLIAQSMHERVPLLTCDEQFRRYPVAVLW